MTTPIKLTSAALGLLAEIINATDANGANSACGYVVVSAPATKSLVEQGLIELNDSVKNAEGEIGARPTAQGREYAKTGSVTTGGDAAGGTPAKARPSFQIEDTVPLPPKTRAPVEQLYPFDQLQVGQSFFVSNDDVKSGNAHKTLQSTVNSANGRYSVETGEFRPNRRNPEKQVPVTKQTRQFELRHDSKDGVAGARVFRVEVKGE